MAKPAESERGNGSSSRDSHKFGSSMFICATNTHQHNDFWTGCEVHQHGMKKVIIIIVRLSAAGRTKSLFKSLRHGGFKWMLLADELVSAANTVPDSCSCFLPCGLMSKITTELVVMHIKHHPRLQPASSLNLNSRWGPLHTDTGTEAFYMRFSLLCTWTTTEGHWTLLENSWIARFIVLIEHIHNTTHWHWNDDGKVSYVFIKRSELKSN